MRECYVIHRAVNHAGYPMGCMYSKGACVQEGFVSCLIVAARRPAFRGFRCIILGVIFVRSLGAQVHGFLGFTFGPMLIETGVEQLARACKSWLVRPWSIFYAYIPS